MTRPLTLLIAAFLLAIPRHGLSQCGAAPVAVAACSGGKGAATSGANINTGDTYWFTGGPTTFAGINLSGGTLRICGTLTLTSITYNSGYIIVESGGKLTIGAGFNVSGATIINRGSLTINGSPTLQGSNNYIYNDLSTSVLTVNGTLTLNGSTTYVINRGTMTVTTLAIQSMAGSVCLQDNSILSLTELDNNVTNGISYSGSGSAACLNVSTTAKLNNDVTNSGHIHVCTNATPTGGAASDGTHGWGSAGVTTGCSSCATVLAAAAVSLKATMQEDRVALQWATGRQPSDNDVFYVERSLDGKRYSTLAQFGAAGGEQTTDAGIAAAVQYYRVKWVSALTGASVYSPVVDVSTGFGGRFRVYPNPLGPGQSIHLLVSSPAAGNTVLFLTDPAGNTIRKRQVDLISGNNSITWDPGRLAAGVYFLSLRMPAGNTLNYRLITTP